MSTNHSLPNSRLSKTISRDARLRVLVQVSIRVGVDNATFKRSPRHFSSQPFM